MSDAPIPAGQALRTAETWPSTASLDALAPGPGGFLILAPHPDDESVGCGGLIAECVARGRTIRVVVLTDGTGSHPGSRSHPPERLGALRREETRAALRELGLDPDRDLDFLNLPDTALPSSGPDFDAAVNRLQHWAKWDGYPAAILTTWGHDPHADHGAARALAGALVNALPSRPKLFAYPVWGWAFAHPLPGFPLPPEPLLPAPLRGVRLSVERHLHAKRRAVAAHRSQTTELIADDPAGFRLPPEALALWFRPFEIFLEEDPAA